MNELIDKNLETYITQHTSPESELLQQIDRETNLEVLYPRMLSGHIQGAILKGYSEMIKPHRILEIGTFTGYSAICMAQGLTDNGMLYTIDVNEELEDRVKSYFQKAGLADKIKYVIGNAVEIIPTIEEEFDLIFIDADKINYPVYYDLVFGKLKKGGFIIADNVLWSGKVSDPNADDKDTLALRKFNSMVQEDDSVTNYLLPVRDGLMVIHKL